MGKKIQLIIFILGMTVYLLGAVLKVLIAFYLGLAVWLLVLVVFLWKRFGGTVGDPFAK